MNGRVVDPGNGLVLRTGNGLALELVNGLVLRTGNDLALGTGNSLASETGSGQVFKIYKIERLSARMNFLFASNHLCCNKWELLTGKWRPHDLWKNKEVLIPGNGESSATTTRFSVQSWADEAEVSSKIPFSEKLFLRNSSNNIFRARRIEI